MKTKFYRKFSFWVLIAVLFLAGFAVFQKAVKAPQVEAAPARRKDIQITVGATALGTVRSEREVNVTAQRIGRITRFHVEEGDTVREGQLLAELDPEEAVLNLNGARAAYQQAKAVLEELQNSHDPQKVEMETAITGARATLKQAESRLKRMQELFSRGLVSASEREAAERDYDVAKAAYDTSISGRDKFRSVANRIEAQKAAVQAARAALDMAGLEYRHSLIRAPIPGVVADRPPRLGETVLKGTLVASVVDMNSLYIEAFIDEVDVAKVRLDQQVKVTMDAYPGTVFEGKVYLLSPLVTGGEREARTFEARVKLAAGEGPAVKPGMSADVEIIVQSLSNALVVPAQAVFERSDGRYLYKLNGGKAHLQKVKAGAQSWEYVEILDGIGEGEQIIVTPDVPGLSQGGRVKVVR